MSSIATPPLIPQMPHFDSAAALCDPDLYRHASLSLLAETHKTTAKLGIAAVKAIDWLHLQPTTHD